ncbi:MAG: response regulator [Bacteroidales bacterium]|nr:response regulator [Bacteroidales bacterium]MCF8456967.1 response regulator [Bacteroidales bacterium]
MKANKILLVEDNPDDAELTLLALRSKNIANEVDITTDGEAALDYLFARGKYSHRDKNELPVFILLDLKMPKMDGHEVLKEIKSDEKLKKIPVIIFTSSLEDKDLDRSYSNGANSYIQKPVNGDQFDEVVENLGLYWLIINEPPPFN